MCLRFFSVAGMVNLACFLFKISYERTLAQLYTFVFSEVEKIVNNLRNGLSCVQLRDLMAFYEEERR